MPEIYRQEVSAAEPSYLKNHDPPCSRVDQVWIIKFVHILKKNEKTAMLYFLEPAHHR